MAAALWLGGAGPLVRASAMDALLAKNQAIATPGRPARGPAADLEVRPTRSGYWSVFMSFCTFLRLVLRSSVASAISLVS
jgi:hypothetical protein